MNRGLKAVLNLQSETAVDVKVHRLNDLDARIPSWESVVIRNAPIPLSYHPRWLIVLARGLWQIPYCLEAVAEGTTLGLLPLMYVRSALFGRFLTGLPYLNYGGVMGEDPVVARQLIDRAVALADELDVRFLELRHERASEHSRLVTRAGSKVHMRLALPLTPGQLWDQLSPKVRNQVRKGTKSELSATWGGSERLDEFYDVFSQNMRDLGTPVYGRRLFHEISRQFPDRTEFCIVRAGTAPVAAALLLHGWGITEVPSASSLRQYNHTSANMLLYWKLLERAIERGQSVFDFGRSSPESNTYRFKKQWGATPFPAVWQHYVRQGSSSDMRPDNPRYERLIRIWQRLPVPITRWIGPMIVRGIP
jgi:FemAB-related protein (PEP-CTERM system-associated)